MASPDELNDDENPAIVEDYKNIIYKRIEVIKSLDTTTRLRILLYIYMNKELGLSELSKKLKKEKSTISYHLSIMKNLDIIREREEKSRKGNPKKYFSVSPDFLNQAILNIKSLEELKSEELIDILINDLKLDSLLLTFIQKLIKNLKINYAVLENKLKQVETEDPNKIREFFLKDRHRFFFVPLDEDDFEFYTQKYNEIEREFLERQRNKKDQAIQAKPYLAWHFIVPVKKILENENEFVNWKGKFKL